MLQTSNVTCRNLVEESECCWGLELSAAEGPWGGCVPAGSWGGSGAGAHLCRTQRAEHKHTGGTRASKQFFPLSVSPFSFFNLAFISSYGNHEYV